VTRALPVTQNIISTSSVNYTGKAVVTIGGRAVFDNAPIGDGDAIVSYPGIALELFLLGGRKRRR
jgi:hypothetical protein